MNTRLIISLLVVGALAFACGPRSHSSESPAAFVAEQSPTAVMSPAPQLPIQVAQQGTRRSTSRNAPTVVQLDSKLKVDVSQQHVRFALNVRNVGKKHAELNFPNGQSYDFVVLDSIGREVWAWSSSRMFTQSVQNKQLGAGEQMEVSEAWRATAKPGKYVAVAMLKSSNYPMEQRAEFVLP